MPGCGIDGSFLYLCVFFRISLVWLFTFWAPFLSLNKLFNIFEESFKIGFVCILNIRLSHATLHTSSFWHIKGSMIYWQKLSVIFQSFDPVAFNLMFLLLRKGRSKFLRFPMDGCILIPTDNYCSNLWALCRPYNSNI